MEIHMKHLLLVIILLVPNIIFGQHNNHGSSEQKTAAMETGLGNVEHPVTTQIVEAQKFFNQGLAYAYAFNHEEAVRSFRRAAELDANLAMAHWGASLALGSNYNLQADANQLKEAYAHLLKAIALAPKASEHERDYINALAKRYSNDPNADRQKLAVEYKTAMSELVKKYPDDLDAATLYAESMMNLRPWQLWTADGKPAEGTLEIVAVLEGVLRRNPKHSGANHYYIHAIEASPNPERGLASAERLRSLAPKAGHLVHMPSHIYIRTGDYEDAAQSNADAIVADREYIQKSGAGGVYPMMYYNHNIHFLASANAMNGRFADALKTARELEDNISKHVKTMPMLEMFMPYRTVVLVRFQKWDELLNAPAPDAGLKITTAFWRFGRGMARAAKRQIAESENELKAFREISKTTPEVAPFGNSTARRVLAVADQTLAGKIAFGKGDGKTAIDILQKAVVAEDLVNYNEPPDWDIPTRELLGGVLLAGNNFVEAEKVFRAEIAKHPRNGRALFGLMESLKKQNKNSSANLVQREFEKAWTTADTKLTIESLSGGSQTASVQANAPALKFADVKLKTGVRLRYAEQGNPNGEPIILLHGYTDSWFSYSQILPLLDAKYHVFALDQRG